VRYQNIIRMNAVFAADDSQMAADCGSFAVVLSIVLLRLEPGDRDCGQILN
jgi:hypothetical protein